MLSLYIHNDRKFGLDILRALAIIQVIYGHGAWMLKGIVPSIPMFDGVELFFVLSGFLIGGILMEIKDWNIHSLKMFWRNRWFRTLPNYYFFLLINVLLSLFLFRDIEEFKPGYLFFAQNFGFNANSENWFAESWSLAVEEWFYLLIPLLIIVLNILSKNHAVLLAGIVLLMTSFVFKELQFENLKTTSLSFADFDIYFRKVTFLRFDAISLGILFAYLQKRKIFFQLNVFRYGALILSIFVIIFSIYLIETAQQRSVYYLIFAHFMSAVGFAFSLPFFSELKIHCRTNWFTRSIVWISLISYSMYLIHYSIIDKIIKAFFWPDSGIKAMITFIVYLSLTIGIAFINFKFFESRITQLRNRFKTKSQ